MENYNKNTSTGVAEDIIRGLMHLVALEMHLKTDIEKLTSELETGDYDNQQEHVEKITIARRSSGEITDMRRSDMLKLYQLFGEKGDKSYWCIVKHLLFVAMSSFEVWQATNDSLDYEGFLKANELLNLYVAMFIGVEVTDCASCFSDILKAEEVRNNVNT